MIRSANAACSELSALPLLSFRSPTAALIALLVVSAGSAADRPANLTSDFVVPDGLEVTLWAETPDLRNPTNIDVDYRGRIWVAEAVNYRRFRGSDVNQPASEKLRHPEGDRILILEDTDGDGRCDSTKVFVQDKDLVAPLGVGVIGNRVFVSCSPNLIVYTIDESGDRPAKKEIFLTGFGGHDHDHGLHAVTAGPDGRLYFNVGNAGPHIVTDKSGWTLRSGSIYTGGTPYNLTNTPALKSDDGRIWTGGLALRMNPDGTGLTVMAHNFRNAYELALDSFGNMWQSDNDDEVQACRVSWVMEGANMGFFSADGSRTWRADKRPWQTTQTAQWHQDDPGVFPAGDIYGAGGPTGAVVYEGDLLPKRFQGMILSADAGRNTIFGHIPHPEGAGYRLERTIFLSSKREDTSDYRWDKVAPGDKTTWFRPSDVAVGTDGAVYVSDWYDPIVGGHAMHDNAGAGRILRIAPKGKKVRSPRIDLATEKGQIAALKSPAVNVRYAGYTVLSGMSDRPWIARMMKPYKKWHQARALWAARETHLDTWSKTVTEDDVVAFLRRRWTYSPQLGSVWSAFGHRSPSVRREAAVLSRNVVGSPNDSKPAFPYSRSRALLRLASGYKSGDRAYLEALGIACEGNEEQVYWDVAGRLFDPLKWTPECAEIIWRLRPIAAIPDMGKRAASIQLSVADRKQAIDTLAFIKHADAARTVAELAVSGPEDTREYALWWAKFRAGNDWSGFGPVQQLVKQSEADLAARAKLAATEKLFLDSRNPRDKREAAASELALSKEGGLRLVALAAEGKLPAEFIEFVTEHIFRNADLGVRALASQHFRRKTLAGEALPPIADLAKITGDAKRGRDLFLSEKVGCSTCHRVGADGKDVGPDLTQARTKFNRETLLDAVLNPSAAIAFGYEPWLIETSDGDVYTGFIIADGDVVTLKEVSGEQRTMRKDQVASRQKQTVSIMPDNIAMGLTAQQLADVVEFVLSNR